MNELEKLRDIKTIVEIEDYSLYFLILASIIGILIVIALISFFIKLYKNRQKRDKRLYYLNRIKKADLNNPKKAAYTITKYARLLVEDEKQEQILEKVIEDLEKYKYKNTIQSFDDESRKLMKLFMEVAHV